MLTIICIYLNFTIGLINVIYRPFKLYISQKMRHVDQMDWVLLRMPGLYYKPS